MLKIPVNLILYGFPFMTLTIGVAVPNLRSGVSASCEVEVVAAEVVTVVVVVEELDETERGEGGYGHTGVK